MLSDLPRVSSARAADIVDVGYEGFRSYLKRGLLGRVGMLPGFHRAGANTHDDPAPRSKWMTFGFADLCLMRIAKLLMDRGFTFESANAAVSQHAIWSYMQHDSEPVERYLLIWPPYGDHIVFDTGDLHHLPARMKEAQAQGVITLLNLAEVQQHVANQLMRPEKPEINN
ncbi:hypothetical protein [Sphingomonas sp.]|uniref:hypothetical protein n=1 Tax=Sphingomonas sp. TaxID=28214 RepID=UPI002897AF73|nr:hypothetical protein [Sphingomonas sp.]